MRVLSLFSGIGGLDLGSRSEVSPLGIELHKPLAHELNGYLFELGVPNSVLPCIRYCQIIGGVVVLVEVNVMDHFALREWRATLFRCYCDVFGDVSARTSVRMIWHEQIEVPISKRGSLPTLPLRSCRKNATALPRRIGRASLVPLGRHSRWNSHATHGPPHNLLRRAVFSRDFRLSHAARHIVVEEIVLRERNGIGVHIAHGNIVTRHQKNGGVSCEC